MLIKLSEYDKRYRPDYKARALSTLRKQAGKGKIPGAFQMSAGGDWWVDTETHDKLVRENITSNQICTFTKNGSVDLYADEQAFIDKLDDEQAFIDKLIEQLT